MVRDLDALGITSATVNIRITTFMYSRPGPRRIEHVYGGEKYYFDAGYVGALDETLGVCRDRRIAVAAIILINNAASAADPVIGPLLQHPDYTSEGNYSMPDMSAFRSVRAYAAALDFLAGRYCRPDGVTAGYIIGSCTTRWIRDWNGPTWDPANPWRFIWMPM